MKLLPHRPLSTRRFQFRCPAEEIGIWMNAPAKEALQLQRPLPDNGLILLPQAEAEERLLL